MVQSRYFLKMSEFLFYGLKKELLFGFLLPEYEELKKKYDSSSDFNFQKDVTEFIFKLISPPLRCLTRLDLLYQFKQTVTPKDMLMFFITYSVLPENAILIGFADYAAEITSNWLKATDTTVPDGYKLHYEQFVTEIPKITMDQMKTRMQEIQTLTTFLNTNGTFQKMFINAFIQNICSKYVDRNWLKENVARWFGEVNERTVTVYLLINECFQGTRLDPSIVGPLFCQWLQQS